MNKKLLRTLMILSASVLVTSCGSKNTGDGSYVVTGDTWELGLAGKAAKKTYNALIATSVGDLNYLFTSEQADAQHFANFVDPLLTHNEFGVLEKNLATKVTHTDDWKEFTFTIRDDVPWVRYDGSIYQAPVNGQMVDQYVKPSDWVASALAICTSSHASSLDYLVTDFVKGAAEYYYYTAIQDGIALGTSTFVRMDGDNAKQAKWINQQIQAEKPSVWENGGYTTTPLTADDIPNIANLSRLGIQANDETHTLKYTLVQSAFYFPTMMTYSCYLPVNQQFLTDTRWSSFGTSFDKILYCGPFLLDHFDENNIVYKKNQNYFKKDRVFIETVNFKILPDEIGSDYTRTEFEAGNIDGFGISQTDEVGWEKYIVGPNGDGTMENPYDPNVNSRLLDTIGSMYGSNIVMERIAGKRSGQSTSYSSFSTSTSVANTEKALRLEPVRRAILNGLDYTVYNERYGTSDVYQKQYMVHTYTPINFVTNDNGGDYISDNYYNVYAEKKNMPIGDVDDPQPGTVAYELQPGYYDHGRQKTDAEVWALSQNAQAAVQAWNAANPSDKIDLPIYVEFYSSYYDADQKKYDDAAVLKMNQRLNNTTGTAKADFPYFYVIPTDKVTASNYSTVSQNAIFDYSAVLWGWGADYGDPLSYANTYTIGGDWGSIFEFVNMPEVPNYTFDATAGTLTKSNLLAHYTSVVKQAAAETTNLNERYNLFAQSEYELIEELSIYMPQVNYGQGWSMSISKAAGYYNPTANYGISDERLIGLWVLENSLTREERVSIREKHQAAKDAYTAEHGSINIYD